MSSLSDRQNTTEVAPHAPGGASGPVANYGRTIVDGGHWPVGSGWCHWICYGYTLLTSFLEKVDNLNLFHQSIIIIISSQYWSSSLYRLVLVTAPHKLRLY